MQQSFTWKQFNHFGNVFKILKHGTRAMFSVELIFPTVGAKTLWILYQKHHELLNSLAWLVGTRCCSLALCEYQLVPVILLAYYFLGLEQFLTLLQWSYSAEHWRGDPLETSRVLSLKHPPPWNSLLKTTLFPWIRSSLCHLREVAGLCLVPYHPPHQIFRLFQGEDKLGSCYSILAGNRC